jgi:hypothetical protein
VKRTSVTSVGLLSPKEDVAAQSGKKARGDTRRLNPVLLSTINVMASIPNVARKLER